MHLPVLRDGAGKNWTAHIISVVPGSNPIFCAGADLDGDRDVDLVVADFGGNTIRWYENHARGHDEPNTWNAVAVAAAGIPCNLHRCATTYFSTIDHFG